MTGLCRRWVGPVWKTGGETCVCALLADHSDGRFGSDHECSCGAWFVDTVSRPPSGGERSDSQMNLERKITDG